MVAWIYRQILLDVEFISIANAQEVYTVDNKGTKDIIFKPTIAERYDSNGTFDISNATTGTIMQFNEIRPGTDIDDSEHYESEATFIKAIKAGTYRVSYRITADLTLGDPSRSEYIIAKCSAPCTGSYSQVLGTKSVLFHQAINEGKSTVSASRIITLGAGDKLAIIGRKDSGITSTVTMQIDGSSFLVERFK